MKPFLPLREMVETVTDQSN